MNTSSDQKAHWILDISTRRVERSAVHDQLFGYEDLLPHWNIEFFMGHMLQEDQPAFIETMKGTIEKKSDFDVKYRVQWPDGSIHTLHSSGTFQPDVTGQSIGRVIGVSELSD